MKMFIKPKQKLDRAIIFNLLMQSLSQILGNLVTSYGKQLAKVFTHLERFQFMLWEKSPENLMCLIGIFVMDKHFILPYLLC